MIAVVNVSFAQDSNKDISTYGEIHYYSAEVIKKNNKDSVSLNERVKENEFDLDEVKDIFSSKFKEVAYTLEQRNKAAVKKDGIIVADEYGRKIYFAVMALNVDHVLIEGGESLNGIFYPNIISTNGISYKEDEKNPGSFIGIPVIIYFKAY